MANLIDRKIRKNEPFEWKELIWYPITVENYEEYLEWGKVLGIMQQSLDIRYMQLTYLKMLYTIDMDTRCLQSKRTTFIKDLFRLLCLCLRYDYSVYEGKEIKTEKVPIKIYEDQNILYLGIKKGEKEIRISEYEFLQLRKLIAKANAIEIPDEATNLELMQWEREKSEENSKDIETDYENEINAVVAHQRVLKKDILSLPIKEFKGIVKAINIEINYSIYALAEMSGLVKFKKGNPYPHWCYPKKKELVEVESEDTMTRRKQLL